jgi:GNAT superfamily N-acetyltransferase
MTDKSIIFVVDPPIGKDMAEVLVELWVEVINAGGAVGFTPPVTADVVAPVADLAFRRVIGGLDHIVVAQAGDQVVGFAFLEQRPGPLFGHWATVKRLQVHPSVQGRGIGSALLEAVHGAAQDFGLEQIHVTVRGGTGAEAFYTQNEYTEVARIPDVVRVAPGDDREEIYLVRRLQPT